MAVIRARHRAESHEGKILINALLHELEAPLPRGIKPAPAQLMRWLDDDVADHLGIRTGRWGAYWTGRILSQRWIHRTVTSGLASRPVALTTGEASALLAREAMTMFARQGRTTVAPDRSSRPGRGPGFDIPERLCRTWGIATDLQDADPNRPPM